MQNCHSWILFWIKKTTFEYSPGHLSWSPWFFLEIDASYQKIKGTIWSQTFDLLPIESFFSPLGEIMDKYKSETEKLA